MNRIFRHKYTIVSLMAAMTMLMVSATGCIMDKEEPAAPDDGLMMVSFRVVTPNQTAASSRGVTPPDGSGNWGTINPDDPGTEFDNLLLADQLKVFITDEHSKNLAEVTMLSISAPSTSGEREYIGFITGDDTFDKVKSDGAKLHVIANAGNDLATNGEIDSDNSFEKSGQSFDAIPMWGVQTVDFSEMKKGERFEVKDPVWLLRAMAKVEILVSDDPDNIITGLNGASLPGVNASGYLLPTGWATTRQTKDLTYAASYRPYTSTIATPLIANPQDADKKKIVFYLPECENPNGDSELRIAVKYSTDDKTDNTGYLRFIKYDNGKPVEDGTPYNIVRNHLYRYTITGINTVEDINLSINYVVCPFDGNYTIVVPDFD